jgi:TolB protein
MELNVLARLLAAFCMMASLCVDSGAQAPASAEPDEIAFASNRAGGTFELYRMRGDGGGVRRLTREAMEAVEVSWSPDGSRVLFVASQGRGAEIYVANPATGEQHRLTRGEALNSSPVWSPDGRHIVFRSFAEGSARLYIMKADGSERRRLTDADEEEASPAFSPDGRQLAYVVLKHPRRSQIKVLDMSSRASRMLSQEPPSAAEHGPVWSPDGRRIAYMVSKDRNNHVHLMAPDGSDKQVLTSGSGRHNDPQWSPDGTRLLMLAMRGGASRQDIYVLKMDGGKELQRLTDDGAEHMQARWSADGERIFFVKFMAGGGRVFASDSEGRQVRRLSGESGYDTGIALCCSRAQPKLAGAQ